jgi:hypothetical protein
MFAKVALTVGLSSPEPDAGEELPVDEAVPPALPQAVRTLRDMRSARIIADTFFIVFLSFAL